MNIKDKYLFSNVNDTKYIKKVLANKKLSGTADIINEYELKIANFFNSKFAIATSSGSSAIQTALFVLDVNQGDNVIVSSTCPVMSVFPIIQVGANIIFCDTMEDNFGLNIDDLEKIITSKTKAVIEVPMWGYPTNIKELKKILESKNIPLILDLAQAHGTKLNGDYLSYYGDISCFSTHDRKILATGEGGFILLNNEEYYNKSKSFIAFGNMNTIDYGLNFKLSALQAALGLNRIDYIPEQLKIRRANAKHIKDSLKHPQINELPIIKNGEPNYYTLLLKLNLDNPRNFIDYLSSRGIPSDIIRYNYKPLYKYPILSKFKRVCPNSEKLSQSITTIPVHPGLNSNEIDYIISTINNYRY
ncbi:aspartate aminotransferase [Candidatus Atribacteria bacterium HGW-Atribacteria-1]|nr:MAG: aspartate aminotransferase [Candidatus Atribacteria bacterium HGW-Atribacteria-1]